MKPSDRTLALNAAWAALWWLVDPEHNRWTKTLEVLNDPASRVTIERGSGDDTGRRTEAIASGWWDERDWIDPAGYVFHGVGFS